MAAEKRICQILRHIRLYPRYLKQAIKAHMEYNVDFFMGAAASVSGHLAALFFLAILYQRVPAIGGWTQWEVILLYGISILSRSIASMLFQGVWSISQLISRGELDKLLVRPVWPLLQVLGSAFGVQGLGHLVSGGAMVILAGFHLGSVWNLRGIFWLILAVLSGCVILISILLIAECVSFWTGGRQTNLPYLAYQLGELGRYPMEVYPWPVQFLITWIIPFAFGTYYPVAAILNKPGAYLAFLSPAMAAAILVLAVAVWRAGLRSYSGTGS